MATKKHTERTDELSSELIKALTAIRAVRAMRLIAVGTGQADQLQANLDVASEAVMAAMGAARVAIPASAV